MIATAVRLCAPTRAPLLALALLVLGAAGCDSFSSLTVNCQVGLKNDGAEVAGCQFTNAGRSVAQSCVKVHVLKPEREELAGMPPAEARTFVSDPLCSGPVEPGAVTEPAQLSFADSDPRTVAEACMRRGDDGKQHFDCRFKIEEVAEPTR